MGSENKILVVDDEENIRWVFKRALEKKQWVVHTAASGEEALDKIQANEYFLVFSDIFLDGMSGLDLLQQVKSFDKAPRIVVMTAQDTMNNTIEAMQKGAYDYISKPFDFDEIYPLVERALDSSASIRPEPEPIADEDNVTVESIIGKSKKMQSVFKTIGKSAMSDLPVLNTGESGTGKEMVARALHNYSRRTDKPFVCINCAAIARELLESELFGHEKGAFTGAIETKLGKFEMANGGTLFLDEIGDMELSLQAKILRVLQNNEFYRVGGKVPIKVDVRIIAATNQDLQAMMEAKQFREDLFHRLNVIHIHLPPLRDRQEDILLLARHFLKKFSKELGEGEMYLSPDVEEIFKRYSWKGNIRELENVMKRALVLASEGPILPEHLPAAFVDVSESNSASGKSWDERLERLVQDYLKNHPDWKSGTELHGQLVQALEKHLFQILLDEFSGKQVATAKVLGINRNTLKRKIDAMGLEPKLSKNKGAPPA